MTKEEFLPLATRINQAYPIKQPISREGFSVWHDLLNDLDVSTLTQAANNYIKKNTFPPTIADLRTEYGKIKDHLEAIKAELRTIYDRTRGVYPYSNDDDETKEVWQTLVIQKPLEERIEYARRIEAAVNRFVREVEASDREEIPTLTGFLKGER